MEEMIDSDLQQGNTDPRHSFIDGNTPETQAIEALNGDHQLMELIVASSRKMLCTFGVLPELLGETDPVEATKERIQSVVIALTTGRRMNLGDDQVERIVTAVYEQSLAA